MPPYRPTSDGATSHTLINSRRLERRPEFVRAGVAVLTAFSRLPFSARHFYILPEAEIAKQIVDASAAAAGSRSSSASSPLRRGHPPSSSMPTSSACVRRCFHQLVDFAGLGSSPLQFAAVAYLASSAFRLPSLLYRSGSSGFFFEVEDIAAVRWFASMLSLLRLLLLRQHFSPARAAKRRFTACLQASASPVAVAAFGPADIARQRRQIDHHRVLPPPQSLCSSNESAQMFHG